MTVSVGHSDFAQRLAEHAPHLASAIERLPELLGDDDITPFDLMDQVVGPEFLVPELHAHASNPPLPHPCLRRELAEWVEMMATSRSRDVQNLVATEVIVQLDGTLMRRFEWGPATRAMFAKWGRE